MKVYELSKQIGVKNKEVITFLKEKGFNISSHMQDLTEEMITLVEENIKPEPEVSITSEVFSDVINKEEIETKVEKDIDELIPEVKHFAMDDLIPCKSVTPWELNALGSDRKTVYHWSGYGDIDYIKYSDLQSMRRKDLLKAPKVIIEDASLCYQWRRELGDTYKHFLNVQYPEEFFDLPDAKFERLLKQAPNTLKEVIRVTAINMIKNENFPTVQKLRIVDDILNTCLVEFL